jgi:transcriptional repressor NrdR
MRCPFCKTSRDRVIDSRTSQDGASVRRRRQCLNCRRRFTTYERAELAPRLVVKKNGERETFNRDKILRGLTKACDKRNIPVSRIEDLIDRVEAKVFDQYEREVPAQAIGELVSEELRALDQVAYVRFASVYRRFEDISGFEKILAALLRKDGSGAPRS